MNMRIVATAALFVVVGANDVHADWLDNAWSDTSVARHGNPAITVRADGVSVVLPAETLDEAYSEQGMNRKDALLAFLDRYSPRCSSVLDLNIAQPNLTVELSIQGKTSLDDMSATAEDEIFTAMEKLPAPKDGETHGRADVPHITQVFAVLPGHFTFTLDYAPVKKAHCVTPQDLVS
jgi:hypothetical protein